MEFNTRILFLCFGIILLAMIYSIEAKPTSSDAKAIEDLIEIEEAQPIYQYQNINRGYDNEGATKRQLKAFAENGVPRNAMEMMRALIALRRYR